MASMPYPVLLLLTLTITFSSHTTFSHLHKDALSLLSFKSSISHDPYHLLRTWSPSMNHCTWYGVTCSQTFHVTSLNLTGIFPGTTHSSLSGKLSPSIGNLTHLRFLSLPDNSFSGSIPPEIKYLRSLETLQLQGNNLSGNIPSEITLLPSLRTLNLSCNIFSGHVPNNLISFGAMNFIDLSNNYLSGGIRISGCEFLTYLKVSNNFLVGEIPGEFGKCINLRILLLDGNIFEGKIPREFGRFSELSILDVSRNSLTGRVPGELSQCRKLNVVVLTNLDGGEDGSSSSSSAVEDDPRGEFNAFEDGVPYEILQLPDLEVFWAPRANLGGRLFGNWGDSCSLRVLNLGLNNFTGTVPESIAVCKKILFLDLSFNSLEGSVPSGINVPCMVYFNVSRNSLSGAVPVFGNDNCEYEHSFDERDIHTSYSEIRVAGFEMNSLFESMSGFDMVVSHDFSWNWFVGSVPVLHIGNEFLLNNRTVHYRLFLNNNKFDRLFPGKIISNCNDLQSFSVDLSVNSISGRLYPDMLLDCLRLIDFRAAENQIDGLIPPEIGRLNILQRLDLSENRLSGSLPENFGNLKDLKMILLGKNNLTGEIPAQFEQLISLEVLNLSQNSLNGFIPATLANATGLETLLLDHNIFVGEIPSTFSNLSRLTQLDLSFNNLSGHIPHFQHLSNCDCFIGNRFLQPCPDQDSAGPAGLPDSREVQKWRRRNNFRAFVIAMATSASIVICFLVVIVLVFHGRRKFSRIPSLRRKIVVTFSDALIELNYENVIAATGNFSLRNLIGTGGFGSTYKAELVPGFFVAVKRLSIGRFQGVEQFDAEIRTLGKIKHNHLVNLIGYYADKAEMFLIYNYLSGGNLETFIHERSRMNVQWPVIHKIAIDVARALAFLHYSCVPRIVHRDIKPSNILLDEELNAYLSDFGLARLLEVSETHATTDVAGTFGYVAPEYATSCRVSDKADVYSFGVVLLELISGKKSLDPSFSEYGNGFNIVSWAELLIKEGRSCELFLSGLWESGPKDNLLVMLRLASICTAESLSVRPSMKLVLQKLKQLES